MVVQVSGILFRVHHLKEAENFYRETLGIEIIESSQHFFSIRSGFLRVSFIAASKENVQTEIYFKSEYPVIRTEDNTIISQSNTEKFLQLRDPNGIKIIVAK